MNDSETFISEVGEEEDYKKALSVVIYNKLKENGVDSLSARTIAERLGCSTQPVLYHFKTIDEIKLEVYKKADEFHSEYIMAIENSGKNPLMQIGHNYIHFGYEEENLFRFLFQTDHFTGSNMHGLADDEQLKPIIQMISGQMKCEETKAKELFMSIFVAAHGIASLIANNGIVYDEEQNEKILHAIHVGIFGSIE